MGKKQVPHLPPTAGRAVVEVVGVGGHCAEVEATDLQELLLCLELEGSRMSVTLQQTLPYPSNSILGAQPGSSPVAHLNETVQGTVGLPSELTDICQGDLQARVQSASTTCTLKLRFA